MERRGVLLKCLGGAALALAPAKLLPATGTGNDRTCEFYELWEEACLSHYWFNDAGEFLQHYDRARAVENKLLAYSALRMTAEAQATTRDYITRFGRVTWPARRALAKIGIDADAMYVELQRRVT
jgi:hypothetical protein